MKERIYKGAFGYLNVQRKREWIKTLLLFCISFGMLFLGMVITKHRNPDISWSSSRNNLLTVAAVLGILPAARFMISAIMFEKAKKYACPEKLYEKVKESCRSSVAYELFLTAYKEEYPLYCCVCTENEVLSCGPYDDKKAGRGEEHIRTILKKEGRNNVIVKLFSDEKAFLDRIRKTADVSEKSEELLGIMKSISI
ncbi:MAG: hypothetical protein J6X66_09030 [Lachnospiraceae bacterium]|nr:hypothetical protein [Lachnospiraceae bacterium]